MVLIPAGCATRADSIAEALVQIGSAGRLTFWVAGGCMGGLLAPDARVALTRRPRYWPGDVVVGYWPEAGFRIHRVIGGYRQAGEWRLLLQADRASRPDRAIPLRQVIGTVVGGDCHRSVVRVPLRHRLWAFGRFLRFATGALRR